MPSATLASAESGSNWMAFSPASRIFVISSAASNFELFDRQAWAHAKRA
jgi:hypothetical protein